MAFFPCTRFSNKIQMWFAGNSYSQRNWDDKKKVEYAMNLHNELHRNYMLFSKMVWIALDKGLKMVIENPYTKPHYLEAYFPIKPKIIDKNRQLNGDYLKKPTQYWFINCNPYDNEILEPIIEVPKRNIDYMYKAKSEEKCNLSVQEMRSEIHPQYANRFIRKYLLQNT